jgi:hypothetical protein
MRRTVIIVALALATTQPATASQPGNSRSFVSPIGIDTNACTLAAPCRTFAVALTNTNAGGEIAVLGTAGYGVLTIDKAISIVNPGGFEAGIAVPLGGTGITINAGPSDNVTLRGLTIEGGGLGAVGIQFNSGQSLTIEDCVVRNMSGSYPQGTGIKFVPSAGTSSLSVSNSVTSNNASHGIVVYPSGPALARAVVDHVQANSNAFGLFVGGDTLSTGGLVLVTVADSVVASNINVGVYTRGSAQKEGRVVLFRSLVANNAFGVQSLDGGIITLAQSMLSGNGTGYDTNLGTIFSYGDNYLLSSTNAGSLSASTKQ